VKIVLDTNVLIAALIARGLCHELLEHCVLRHTLVSSDFILNETHEKLVEKFGYSGELAYEAVSLLRSRMELVVAKELERQVCRDPDDDNILAAAISGKCRSRFCMSRCARFIGLARRAVIGQRFYRWLDAPKN
jgi:putative PIN family toxin of toxin-antitoxin system